MRPSALLAMLLWAALWSLPGGAQVRTPSHAVAPRGTTLATAPDRYLHVGEVRLRYREVGHGAPVVLLHGYADRLDVWESLADSLALGYRVIALDQRGFGESTRPPADPAQFGIHFVDDVIALLDTLHLARAHIVGHSMGGLIAANIALRYPHRVATVTIVAGAFLGDAAGGNSAAVAAVVRPWIADLASGRGLQGLSRWLYPALPDSAVNAMSRDGLAANDLGVLTAAMQSIPALSVPPSAVHHARVPALFVVGTADPVLPANRVRARVWPSARLVVVAGTTHDGVLDTPVLVAAVRARLRSPRPARPPAVGPGTLYGKALQPFARTAFVAHHASRSSQSTCSLATSDRSIYGER